MVLKCGDRRAKRLSSMGMSASMVGMTVGQGKQEWKSLDPGELDRYAWQLDIEGFGVRGQERLKNASVLVTRCGGLGGVVAYELAAAGIGRMVVAHGGQLKSSDMNRQLLMSDEMVGKSRMESIVRRLREFNSRMELIPYDMNVSGENVEELVGQVDLVVDCAPLFEERYLLNREVVRRGIPMVECAVYEMEAVLTCILPGKTPCLRCLYPEVSRTWTRKFPVFGAVSGSLGSMAAMEAIKILAGFGEPLMNRMLHYDLRSMRFETVHIHRVPECVECGHMAPVVI